MAATGISVSDECATKFNDIKLGRIKAQFVIYKIEGKFLPPQILPSWLARLSCQTLFA
jgi:hypothetical protein